MCSGKGLGRLAARWQGRLVGLNWSWESIHRFAAAAELCVQIRWNGLKIGWDKESILCKKRERNQKGCNAFYLKSEGYFFPKSTFITLSMANFVGKKWLGHLLSVPIFSDGPVSVVPREIALGPSEIFHRRRRLCGSNNPFDKIMKKTFWFIRRSFFSIRKEYGKVSFPHSSWIRNWLLFPYYYGRGELNSPRISAFVPLHSCTTVRWKDEIWTFNKVQTFKICNSKLTLHVSGVNSSLWLIIDKKKSRKLCTDGQIYRIYLCWVIKSVFTSYCSKVLRQKEK